MTTVTELHQILDTCDDYSVNAKERAWVKRLRDMITPTIKVGPLDLDNCTMWDIEEALNKALES